MKLKSHPNLASIYDIYQTKNNHYIIMDSLEGTLKHFMENKIFLPEYEVIHIIDNILQGLYCLNKNGIMHRDINHWNIRRKNKDGD